MKKIDIEPSKLPDTGTLRGDLVAMIKPPSIRDGERKLRIMAGLFSMLWRNPELAQATNAAIVEPRVAANRILIQRAIDRGEISPDSDVETLALISPSMAAYRSLILQKPVDREFLISLIDEVLMPAFGLRGHDGGFIEVRD